jgi:hypothetical protein
VMTVTARMARLCDKVRSASRRNLRRSRGLSIEWEDMENPESNHAHPVVDRIPAGCLDRLREASIVAGRERRTSGGAERRLNAAKGLSLREQGLALAPGPRLWAVHGDRHRALRHDHELRPPGRRSHGASVPRAGVNRFGPGWSSSGRCRRGRHRLARIQNVQALLPLEFHGLLERSRATLIWPSMREREIENAPEVARIRKRQADSDCSGS